MKRLFLIPFLVLSIFCNAQSIPMSLTGLSTIADLRLQTIQDTQIITVLGVTSAKDGNGSDYYWDNTSTAADNGMTVIKENTVAVGRWIRMANYYNMAHIDSMRMVMVATLNTYSDPNWLTTLSWNKIIGKPSIYSFSGTGAQYTKGDGTYATFPSVYSFAGLSSQYTDGTGLYHNFPTNVSNFTNDPPYALAGNLLYNVLQKSVNYTILSTDFTTGYLKVVDLYVDATAGNITITAPSPIVGYTIFVTKTDATSNIVTIAGITGNNTLISQGQVRELHGTLSTWWNH